jgi:hypothetical protein
MHSRFIFYCILSYYLFYYFNETYSFHSASISWYNTLQSPTTFITINPRMETVVQIKTLDLTELIVSLRQLIDNYSLLVPCAVVRVRNQDTSLIIIINKSNERKQVPSPEFRRTFATLQKLSSSIPMFIPNTWECLSASKMFLYSFKNSWIIFNKTNQ